MNGRSGGAAASRTIIHDNNDRTIGGGRILRRIGIVNLGKGGLISGFSGLTSQRQDAGDRIVTAGSNARR